MAAINEKTTGTVPHLLETFRVPNPDYPNRPHIMLRINEIGCPSVVVEMTKPSDFQRPPIKLHLKSADYYQTLRKFGESADNAIDLTKPQKSWHRVCKSPRLAVKVARTLPSPPSDGTSVGLARAQHRQQHTVVQPETSRSSNPWTVRLHLRGGK